MAELTFSQQRRSLISSQARIQVPWVKVTIGEFTFGIFSKETRAKNNDNLYLNYNIQYPNYVQRLTVTKINGQVNTYSLSISYPVTLNDDPNFFEKVFSSVSKTRKIIFSYGDASQPTYVYKNEEAIITKITNSFNFGSNGEMGAVIGYQIEAVSGAALGVSGNYTFMGKYCKPSDEIKKIFKNKNYGLQDLFSGMSAAKLDYFIDGGDKFIETTPQQNVSVLDYINYLVSCMIPDGTPTGQTSKDIYIFTLHDDTSYDRAYEDRELIDGQEVTGPYFKVERVSYAKDQADAYELDIGYNTSTIVTNFSIENQENYSLYYDYNNALHPAEYHRRINNQGEWEDVFTPSLLSNNEYLTPGPEDITWWTKITKFPVNASVTIQGLLRPAKLMQYLRLNIIFPGGRKHIGSGLYIVTKQQDVIDTNGWRTTLNLTKINGDDGSPIV